MFFLCRDAAVLSFLKAIPSLNSGALGNLLFGFKGDTTGEWNKNSMILRKSYSKILQRWKIAAPTVEFLTEKYNSGEPFSMFAAIRAAVSSFMSVISYYTHKITEWGYHYHVCKVCNSYFLAKNRHYEICSDECRKELSITAKQEFNERIKDKSYEQDDKDAYQYWYNRWNKLKNGKNADADAAAAFKVKFDIFRDEAVKRKDAIKKADKDDKKILIAAVTVK